MATWYSVVSGGEQKLRLQGKVESDGVVSFRNGSKWTHVVLASHCKSNGVDPKKVLADRGPREYLARLGENPGGVEVVTADAWDARSRVLAAERRDREAEALESACPGIGEILSLADRVEDDRDRYGRQFEEMMEDEGNDGAAPPAGIDEVAPGRLATLLRQNPRAALYLRARRQSESGHWSDPTGAAGAGRKAMDLLRSGASIEEAAAALASRNEIKWD